jgi:hypothetical protein
MTVNITINADTLEIYQDVELTSIKVESIGKKDKPESECDWIVQRKLKPRYRYIDEHAERVSPGLYFQRTSKASPWEPVIYDPCKGMDFNGSPLANSEILGPITPDMFL